MERYQGSNWNSVVAGLPGAHILQTWEWGQFKSSYGWQPLPHNWRDENDQIFASALVLKRSIPGGLSVLYVPRGPLVNWGNVAQSQQVLQDLQILAKKCGSIFIKIDPEIILGRGIPHSGEIQSTVLARK